MHRIKITTLVLVGLLAVPVVAYGGGLEFDAELTTAQFVAPPVASPGMIVGADVLAVFDEGLTQVEVINADLETGFG